MRTPVTPLSEIKHTFTCSVCNSTVTISHEELMSQDEWRPVPKDWHVLDGKHICNNHQIFIQEPPHAGQI